MIPKKSWKYSRMRYVYRIISVWLVIAAVLFAANADVAAATRKQPRKARATNTDSGKTSRSDSGSAPKEKEVTSVSLETLPSAIARYLAPLEKSSRWGVMIVDVETGAVIYEQNARDRFIPASNRKLFTGALALDQLGPDFTYRTYLYRTGEIRPDGTLAGNLVILPQGDPTFNSELFRQAHLPPDWIYRDWVDKVRAAGIKSVAGELIVDCSDWNLKDLEPRGWPTRILQDYYAPQTSPLTINENLLQMIARPGKPGEPAIIEFAPPAEGYPIINKTVTGGKTSLQVRRIPNDGIEVSGSISQGSKPVSLPTVPCDNPTLYAAAVFRSHLHRAGIPVSGNLRISSKRDPLPKLTTENVLAVYISPPLHEIVSRMMKHSNNHFAEQIYVSVSAIRTKQGSYTASKKLEEEFLQRLGIDTRAIRVEDGSGLSELNNITPESVCQLLLGMARHPAGQFFYDSLAVGGLDGTLRGRMKSDVTLARVHAKTGYINNVVCLSGYADNRNGKRYAFSFLVNNVRTSPAAIKQAQDKLCELLCRLD